MKLKQLMMVSAAALSVNLYACGGDSTPSAPDAGNPAGTVLVNFTVDDTANKVFDATKATTQGMDWKGGMKWTSSTNVVITDGSWGGPWAKLYDDGPWDKGGHEPLGATAADHVWGVTVFVAASSTAQTFEYGLNDKYYQDTYGNGWMWPGSTNGKFIVPANATDAITAPGAVLPAFGTTDLKLVLDPAAILSGFTTATSVHIKGSAWLWGELNITKGSDNKYTFALSSIAKSAAYPHTGLLKTGAKPEFVWVLDGSEYKDTNTNAATAGVTAFTGASGSATTTATVSQYTKDPSCTSNCPNGNTYVTIP